MITTEDGKAIDVEAANLAFARAMSARPEDAQPMAPEPPKKPADPPKPKTPAKKPADAKKKSKTVAAPVSPVIHSKRVESGANIYHSFAAVTEGFHVATGQPEWHADTEMFNSIAPVFGEAMANVAAHNEGFAKYLDSEGTGAAMAYFGLAVVVSQTAGAMLDNHNARGKVPLFFQAARVKLKGFFAGRNRKPSARQAVK